MTKQEEMFKRFDERFVVESSYPGVTCLNTENPEAIKSFIQSEIDLALAEREKELVEMVEERQDLFNFVPEINGYKYIKAKDLDIISLITKDK